MPQSTVYLSDSVYSKASAEARENQTSISRVIARILEKHYGGDKSAGRKTKQNRNND